MTSNGHVIITGPGRAGSTFIVQMLTRLGYDTGFKPYKEPVQAEWRAGCEQVVEGEYSDREMQERLDKLPHIVKSPSWAIPLKPLVGLGMLQVEHLIVPIRDLRLSALSRLDAGLHWMTTGDPLDQEHVLAMVLGKVVEVAVLFEIPCTMIKFPALVTDADYCYQKLLRPFPDLPRKRFKREFKKLARPEQIKWGFNNG